MNSDAQRRLAEAVREACARAALESFERAAMSGLCLEGIEECTIGAVRAVDIEVVIEQQLAADDLQRHG